MIVTREIFLPAQGKPRNHKFIFEFAVSHSDSRLACIEFFCTTFPHSQPVKDYSKYTEPT